MSNLLPHGDFDVISDELFQSILTANNFEFVEPEPYLEILRQPKQRGYRFRYVSEGNTHGGIPAESTEKGQKAYPTVQIANYSGKAAICVSLVTIDDPPKVHAHNLVGKGVKNGYVYIEEEKGSWVVSFPNLGIQHVTKKDLVKVLYEKLCQQYQLNAIPQTKPQEIMQSFDIAALVDSFSAPEGTVIDESVAIAVADEEKKRLDSEASRLAKEIDLSAVRLCFQAFLPDENGHLNKCLEPVYSEPIYDQKAAHAGQLKICRISSCSSSVNGGEEIFMLCDKVQKEDIAVRFYEEKGGKECWEAYGKFSQSDVHKQCAIVLKTPPYIDKAIQTPVEVFMQLKRGKDNVCSEPMKFMYRPVEYDKYKIGEKRKKGLPENIDQIIASGSRPKQARVSAAASVAPIQAGSSTSDNPALNTTGIMFFPTPDTSRR